ncbi:MAG: serpin family protein [Candidatus Riflebacteria bacterium]|nr:serpin family protein [Candidatus Riflebacteria bacterium]
MISHPRLLLAALSVLVLLGAFGPLPASPAPARGNTAAREALVKGMNAFAADMYVRMSSVPGNLFFSPTSLSFAMGMPYGGARSTTASQIARTFHYPGNAVATGQAMAALTRDLRTSGVQSGILLNVANSVWLQKGFGVMPAFSSLVRSYFGSGLLAVDFARATEAARQTINAWVERQTNKKIRNLIPAGVLTRQTHLVLANALYFKAAWSSRFYKEATSREPFFLGQKTKTTASMMTQTGQFPYAETPHWQMLEMPYLGERFSMVVLLPKKVDGLAALEKDINWNNLAGSMARLEPRRVEVHFPKFRVETTYSLKQALSNMGMPAAFNGSLADFSGITGRRNLVIDAVLHKAFADVNEEGTEAAAATAITCITTGIPDQEEPAVFRADRPFLFLIRDKPTGCILFMGRLARP